MPTPKAGTPKKLWVVRVVSLSGRVDYWAGPNVGKGAVRTSLKQAKRFTTRDEARNAYKHIAFEDIKSRQPTKLDDEPKETVAAPVPSEVPASKGAFSLSADLVEARKAPKKPEPVEETKPVVAEVSPDEIMRAGNKIIKAVDKLQGIKRDPNYNYSQHLARELILNGVKF